MFSVIYSDRATKALLKMDKQVAMMVFAWIDKNLENCENPRLHGSALKHDLKGYWRYRVGDYRLITEIQDNILIIEIIEVRHRRDIY